jgi:uncharacterized BrkB/YihY/UPF0761 family membrane protein
MGAVVGLVLWLSMVSFTCLACSMINVQLSYINELRDVLYDFN